MHAVALLVICFGWLACISTGYSGSLRTRNAIRELLDSLSRLGDHGKTQSRPLDALATALFAFNPPTRWHRPPTARVRPRDILMQSVEEIVDEASEGLSKDTSSAAATPMVSPFEEKEETDSLEADKVTVKFQPGGLGLSYSGGTIVEVSEESQAHLQGVEVGWRIVAIDGEECDFFDDERVSIATQGTMPFQVTFEKAAPVEGLPLTRANVEMVLEEIRPYLINDGGNVKLVEIDGPAVILELEGACSGCPSSAMTMKMGIEKNLKEYIPEIEEVIQVAPESETLSLEAVDVVLEEVRPFIRMADKNAVLEVLSIEGPDVQPLVKLRMTSNIGAVKSVKVEITSRIQRKFANPGLRIKWEGE